MVRGTFEFAGRTSSARNPTKPLRCHKTNCQSGSLPAVPAGSTPLQENLPRDGPDLSSDRVTLAFMLNWMFPVYKRPLVLLRLARE
jgi:hypothetical protein